MWLDNFYAAAKVAGLQYVVWFGACVQASIYRRPCFDSMVNQISGQKALGIDYTILRPNSFSEHAMSGSRHWLKAQARQARFICRWESRQMTGSPELRV